MEKVQQIKENATCNSATCNECKKIFRKRHPFES